MQNTGYNIFVKRKGPFRVIVCAITLWSFLFTAIWGTTGDLAWAARTPLGPSGVGSNRAGSLGAIKELDLETFTLPHSLGLVKDVWKGNSGKTVIHIQDAHCNYSCQQSIKGIIGYLNREYGLDLALLEGGAGDYDLSIFTEIRDKPLREKVADYFVKEGRVNGAEFFAINNPNRITLKGLEEPDLYIKNLKAYRESLAYKDEVDRILNIMEHYLSNLKRHVYSEELKEFEEEKKVYNDKKDDLRKYLIYLAALSKKLSIDISKNKDLYNLIKTIEQEKDIDFRQANSEREHLIGELTKRLSTLELETLVEKSLNFKEETIKQTEFYSYLFRKARTIDVNIERAYPSLSGYKKYIDTHDFIDSWILFNEIEKLEDDIVEELCGDARQKKLYTLSKNLSLLKDLFNISLTTNRYKCYQENRHSLDTGHFLSFINTEALKYKIKVNISDDIEILNTYRQRMEEFYETAFKRDRAFLKNIISHSKDKNSLIVVSGGFHSENLQKLLEEKGYSYISILPNFNGNEESPYFNLLSNGQSKIEKLLNEAISTMAFYSPFTELGITAAQVYDPDVNGIRQVNIFQLSVLTQKELLDKGVFRMKVFDGEVVICRQEDFNRDNENITLVRNVEISGNKYVRYYEKGASEERVNVAVIDGSIMSYETHQVVIDEIIDEAERRLLTLEEKSDLVKEFVAKDIQQDIAEWIVYEHDIQLAQADTWFPEHASWRGMTLVRGTNEEAESIDDRLEISDERLENLLHVVGALHLRTEEGKTMHEANETLETVLDAGDIQQLNSMLRPLMLGEGQKAKHVKRDQKSGRDFAADKKEASRVKSMTRRSALNRIIGLGIIAGGALLIPGDRAREPSSIQQGPIAKIVDKEKLFALVKEIQDLSLDIENNKRKISEKTIQLIRMDIYEGLKVYGDMFMPEVGVPTRYGWLEISKDISEEVNNNRNLQKELIEIVSTMDIKSAEETRLLMSLRYIKLPLHVVDALASRLKNADQKDRNDLVMVVLKQYNLAFWNDEDMKHSLTQRLLDDALKQIALKVLLELQDATLHLSPNKLTALKAKINRMLSYIGPTKHYRVVIDANFTITGISNINKFKDSLVHEVGHNVLSVNGVTAYLTLDEKVIHEFFAYITSAAYAGYWGKTYGSGPRYEHIIANDQICAIEEGLNERGIEVDWKKIWKVALDEICKDKPLKDIVRAILQESGHKGDVETKRVELEWIHRDIYVPSDIKQKGSGTMGRWNYTHATLAPNGKLTLHNPTRIPRNDGVIEEEFLIDGENRPIVLQTRAMNEPEISKSEGIEQETTKPRVIVRDDSAIRHRIYGTAAQGIPFVREDIIARGNRDQIKEAFDHENRELSSAEHDDIRAEQYQGGLRSLIRELSESDKMAIKTDEKMRMRQGEYHIIHHPTTEIMNPDFVEETFRELLKAFLSGPAMSKNRPCTIGVVVDVHPGEDTDTVLQNLARKWEGARDRLKRMFEIEKKAEMPDITLVACVDDGTNEEANRKRLRQFAEDLQKAGNPPERTFACVISNADRKRTNFFKSIRTKQGKSLNEVAHLCGLNGQFLPVSWQLPIGHLVVNLIDSKSRKNTNEDERIKALVEAIIMSISKITKVDYERLDATLGEKLRSRKTDSQELKRLFDGVSLVLYLPDIVPLTVDSIHEYRKADERVLPST